MKKLLMASATLALGASGALAGGIDRSGQGVGLIFEETGETGNYVQFSVGNVSPTANGSYTFGAAGTGFGATPGDEGVASPLSGYVQAAAGYKRQITDEFSLSLIYDQPFGAFVEYESGAPFFGGTADISSDSVTILGRYEMGGGFSVHGGLRTLKVGGEIFTIFDAGPTGSSPALLEAESETGLGAVVGVAYEVSDIALRVAITYSSSVDLTFTGTEGTLSAPDPSASPAVPAVDTEFEMTFPESINLDFQSGVAADTLVFGSVRWAAWDGFNLTTDGSGLVGSGAPRGDSQYVNFEGDTYTYSLGVGRRVTDEISVAVSYTYEDRGNEPSTTALAPTTGLQSVTLSGSYNAGNGVSYAGGITYGVPGDQLVENATLEDPGASFDDNEVIGVGFRIGYAF